jgi:hypothetical protein
VNGILLVGVRRLKMMVRFGFRCLIGGFLMLSPQFANAQISGGGATLPPSAISAFQANPGQLLSQFPNGGPQLTKQVRDLVGSDKATLAAIITLAVTANEDQRKAIADALAQIAKAYATSGDPGFANQIQQAVANSGLPEFSKAYAAAAGDTGTASTGGGGAGGGGGPTGAGAPTGGSNTGTIVGNNTAVTTTSGLLNGGSPGGGGFSQVSPR